ncbi:MAG: putative 2-aminoethylphosphonate ABC transporter ATP-binding protein [Candidatus Rokuibacteriota bacterium]|nr:MAG: putative 2-aminoethylphosphonate ABC transporter ATP-binding protein [Candidatus Rokubacteria bacterium]
MTTRSVPYLRIRNLTKKFGAFTALDHISLEIAEGEFVCFLGPSGCGKTTLLRAIAGLDIQTSGGIEQGGRDISALPPTKRDFGIVFQSYALFPNLTAAKNVAYGLENTRAKRADVAKRVRELLDMIGLGEHGGKYPAQLSGGQQQRVALARALATSPGLLLLDEPLSALDAKVRVRLRHEIKQLQRRLGVTTIMVTHDQEEALTMADRIVVMNHGAIEQIGPPLEIYREPASPFVADFIGLMNFVAGTVVHDGVVRLGRVELACEADGLAAGTEVTLAIRPEDIVVQDAPGPGSEPNSLRARVDALAFLGSFFRADLAGDALEGVLLRADLPVDLVRRLGIAEKSTLSVRLPRERIRIYPGSTVHR